MPEFRAPISPKRVKKIYIPSVSAYPPPSNPPPPAMTALAPWRPDLLLGHSPFSPLGPGGGERAEGEGRGGRHPAEPSATDEIYGGYKRFFFLFLFSLSFCSSRPSFVCAQSLNSVPSTEARVGNLSFCFLSPQKTRFGRKPRIVPLARRR